MVELNAEKNGNQWKICTSWAQLEKTSWKINKRSWITSGTNRQIHKVSGPFFRFSHVFFFIKIMKTRIDLTRMSLTISCNIWHFLCDMQCLIPCTKQFKEMITHLTSMWQWHTTLHRITWNSDGVIFPSSSTLHFPWFCFENIWFGALRYAIYFSSKRCIMDIRKHLADTLMCCPI